MTLGEINKADLLDSGQSLEPYEEIANIVFIAFLFLMPMVLINLTVRLHWSIPCFLVKVYHYCKKLQLRIDIDE